MERHSFIYQLYWLRVLIVFFIIAMLPMVEYTFWGNITTGKFLLFSTIITFTVANVLYKPIGNIIKRNGVMEFFDTEIIIHQKKNKCIKIEEIVELLCEKRSLYGIQFCLLIILSKNNMGKRSSIRIMSEDLNGQQLEDCDLYKCYKEMKLKRDEYIKARFKIEHIRFDGN